MFLKFNGNSITFTDNTEQITAWTGSIDSSQINDFGIAVSGLLPPSNFTSLSGISGITVTNSGTDYFVSLSDPTIQLNDITDLSSDARTFLLTPSSTNLQSLISDETGSGSLVFNTSPAFSGTPTVPTAPSGTNSTQIASTAFVRSEIANLIDSSPNTLDTLNELAAALGDDPNFAATVASGLANKAPLVHTHIVNDITDFGGGVSGLLPVTNITGSSGIVVSNSGTIYNVSSNGLAFISGANFSSLSVTGIPVSVSGHLHDYTDIINWASGIENEVSTLLVEGSYINIDYDNIGDTLTISATGLQPSGNYANAVHSHGNISSSGTIGSTSGLLITTGSGGVLTTSSGINSSYITNFNSSVSGLLVYTSGLNTNSIIPILGNNYNNSTNSTIGGGSGNSVEANYGFVGGGRDNFVGGEYGLVGGGQNNGVSTNHTSIVGGLNNTASGIYSFIGGGNGNYITIDSAVVGGGNNNIISTSGELGFIGGGANNRVYDYASSVLGGLSNIASGNYSTILGGQSNFSSGNYGSILGGQNNNDNGYNNVFILGSNISATQSDTTYLQNLIAQTGNFTNLFVNSSGVSLVGHTHTSSNITDFDSSVSGLLPVTNILGGSNITVSQSGSVFTVAVTGSLGLTTEEVDDRVSSLLTEGSYIDLYYDDDNNLLTISATGLQPSGDYSVAGHSHVSTDISDFSSAVSGLLPVKDIVAGTGIGISSTSGIYTINSTGSGVLADQAKSIVTTVFNDTGSPVSKMSAVYIDGGQGDRPTIALAVGSGDPTSAGTYGLVYETIPNMEEGKVIVFGALTGLDTDQFNPTAPTGDVNGTVLYLSPTTPGGLTTTKPHAPDHMVVIGTIVRTHQNEGVIEVRIQNGYELEELHNVAISGATSGQFLQYNGSGLWIPSSSGNFTTLQVNGTGVSLVGHTHTSSDITNFNSAVSGLLPTIANSGDNRILTSTGSSVGVNAESNLVFTGSNLGVNTTSPSGALHVVGSGLIASVTGTVPNHLFHVYSAISGANIFNVEGTNGSLFSVVDSLSGTLMSVNNSAGLPVFEVFSDDRVVAGRYNQNDFAINSSGNIGIGSSGNNSYKLNVVGNTNISGVLSVNGTSVVTNITAGSGISISSSSGNFTISAIENIINSSNLYLWANFR